MSSHVAQGIVVFFFLIGLIVQTYFVARDPVLVGSLCDVLPVGYHKLQIIVSCLSTLLLLWTFNGLGWTAAFTLTWMAYLLVMVELLYCIRLYRKRSA